MGSEGSFLSCDSTVVWRPCDSRRSEVTEDLLIYCRVSRTGINQTHIEREVKRTTHYYYSLSCKGRGESIELHFVWTTRVVSFYYSKVDCLSSNVLTFSRVVVIVLLVPPVFLSVEVRVDS